MKKIIMPTARKIFEAGGVVRICPCKINPENPWGLYADVSIDTVDDFEKTVNAFRYYNCNNETGVNPAFYIKEMSLSLDVAYDLYRKDWCKTRGFRLTSVQKAFDKGEEYNGQMFVCKNEFADCEYQDKEYVKYLFSLLFKN